VVVFGIVGYLMKKFGFEPGPLVLAYVPGELLESSMRRSLLVFGGDPTGFFGRPISATLLVVFVLVAVVPGIRKALARRKTSIPAQPVPAASAPAASAPAEIKEKV
jgi:putative tricarboxylic transport membrane protein